MESQYVFEKYITKLEKYLGIQKTSMNMERLWQETNHIKTNRSLTDYFEHFFEWVANPDQWTGFFKTFDEEYESVYAHQPVLNPQLRFKRYMDKPRNIRTILTTRLEIGYQQQ